jgi:amino acid transporter
VVGSCRKHAEFASRIFRVCALGCVPFGCVATLIALHIFTAIHPGNRHLILLLLLLLPCLLQLCIALGMAELASAYPTSGGMYYWQFRLAGRRVGPFACWVTGVWCAGLCYAVLC